MTKLSISGVCGLFGDIWNGCGFSITSSPLFSQKLSAIPVSAFCDSLSKPQFEKLVRFCFIKVSFCILTKVSCIPTYEAPFFLFLKMIYKVTFFKIWLGAMKLTVSQYSASVCCYCCFQFTYSFVVSWDRVSLCGPGCPLTRDNPLVSVLQVLGTTILESSFMRGTNIILHSLLACVDGYLHTGILSCVRHVLTQTHSHTHGFFKEKEKENEFLKMKTKDVSMANQEHSSPLDHPRRSAVLKMLLLGYRVSSSIEQALAE